MANSNEVPADQALSQWLRATYVAHFPDHADAVCDVCDRPLQCVNIRTQNPFGKGQWRAYCRYCERDTLYDLEPPRVAS